MRSRSSSSRARPDRLRGGALFGVLVLAGALVVGTGQAAGAWPHGRDHGHGHGHGHRAAGAAYTEPGHRADGGRGFGACDRLDSSQCLLPFPNDWWTKPDRHTVTGRRVDFPTAAMPRDVVGVPISPTEYNRMDGFSPGQTIIAHVPGLTDKQAFQRSGIAGVTDIGAYLDPKQPVVVIDAATGKRWPVWSELDVTAGSPGSTDLLIHPAVNFREDTRYIVALRYLRRSDGSTIDAPGSFARYLHGHVSRHDRRGPHMRELLSELGHAGIGRRGMYLAWDFTVASSRSLTGRMLSMRNHSYARLGDTDLSDLRTTGHAPPAKVVKVENRSAADDPDIARQVTLDVTVPCYIWPSCSLTGSAVKDITLPKPIADKLPISALQGVGVGRFLLSDPRDPYAVPLRNPIDFHAQVICDIPRQALDGKHPVKVRPSLYGHGLFGSADEVNAHNVRQMAHRHGVMFCGTDWTGMAEGDVPNVMWSLLQLGHIPSVFDRTQQGILDFLLTGRAMIARGGFGSLAPFRVHGHSIIDNRRLYYDGNSQGGIFGATLTALEPDLNRAVLGVPGMDYSVLLYRSADFVPKQGSFGLQSVLDVGYPDPAERVLAVDLIQMLWDRADPDGYVAHLTNHPLPDTPRHQVLMQMAFGDHQVANITAETEARTIGARMPWPALQPGRSVDKAPYWGIRHLTRYPYRGSAMTVFDTGPVRTVDGQVLGTDPPPAADVPDRGGVDPHEAPRNTVCGQQQKSDFLRIGGVVTAPCGGPPYFAAGYTG